MRIHFWKLANHIVGYFPFLAIFSILVLSANLEVKDFDLWLHIAMGKHILASGSIPNADVLSATIAGTPWINHEWLFQIVVFKIFDGFGPQGLIFMQAVVVTATVLVLLFLGYHRDRQLLTAVLLFLLYMVYQQRFTIRPDLFSLLFFSLYIFVLSLHIDKKWAIPFLFVIQLIWSNMHGFFFLRTAVCHDWYCLRGDQAQMPSAV